MDLDLNVHKDGDHSVLEVAGEIDVYTAPKLREQLIELVSDGSYHIVVDLEKVDFLDSTGLGVLVEASGPQPRRRGELTMPPAGPRIRPRRPLACGPLGRGRAPTTAPRPSPARPWRPTGSCSRCTRRS